jgi:hypothetical protein
MFPVKSVAFAPLLAGADWVPCFCGPQLSEAEFWKRYFQSKLFNSHRASIRSSATQFVVKDDPIFDKYLEKEDDGEFSTR